MSQLLHGTGAPLTEGPGDAELISAVRAGDLEAYGSLFERHVGAARRLARQLVSAGDVDDLVSEAFAKVLGVLQRGGGPDLAFRAYLLTSVRRLHVDKLRAGSRLKTTDDLTPYDPGVPFRDTAVEGFESGAAARAFASLPERWQMVLWHTEVEGQKPAEVGVLLGMTANSVAALAYRAREGLRQAFVSMHAQEAEDDVCIGTQQNMGAYIRGGMSRREAAKVETHIGDCRRCMAVYLELTEVNSNLRGILAPLILGGSAAAYLGALGGLGSLGAVAFVKGGVIFLAGRARDLVLANAPVSAVAGVAATAAVATGVVIVATPNHPQPVADRPAVIAPSPRDTGAGNTPGSGQDQHPGNGHGPGAPGTTSGQPTARPVGGGSQSGSPFDVPIPLEFASGTPSDDLSPSPSDIPTEEPTEVATEVPTEGPTQEPTGDPSPTEGTDHDLAVVAHATAIAGLAWQVDVDVQGLPAGENAIVTVTSSSLAIALTLDPRCAGLELDGSARCQVQSPADLQFLAVPVPGSSTTLTFTVAWDGDVADPDPSDNTTTVELF